MITWLPVDIGRTSAPGNAGDDGGGGGGGDSFPESTCRVLEHWTRTIARLHISPVPGILPWAISVRRRGAEFKTRRRSASQNGASRRVASRRTHHLPGILSR
jgi:hypothetical protein